VRYAERELLNRKRLKRRLIANGLAFLFGVGMLIAVYLFFGSEWGRGIFSEWFIGLFNTGKRV
jgi:hypothetical protein